MFGAELSSWWQCNIVRTGWRKTVSSVHWWL